ncbi:MAG: response regulator transcription factor [Asticcacaulis sp.]|uniref:response regulator transcription factor n=1 Tax=Asticcacaulis sp. TaxID=1872648 RepID=UPI003F7C7046
MHILIVEDDEPLGQAIRGALTQGGHSARLASDGPEALTALAGHEFDALALDLKLPTLSGLDMVNAVRRLSSVAIVIMSADERLSVRIGALDAGADDFIVKPFNIAELIARLRAVVRRAGRCSQPVLRHRDIEIDPRTGSVHQGGRWVKLTAREFQLLELLMSRSGDVIAKHEIEARIYGANSADSAESNTIEAGIYTLRKKLGKNLVQNVRGVGYRLCD